MTPMKADEIRKMERAGQLAARLLTHLGKQVKVGITTNDLDRMAAEWVKSNDCIPAPLNYHGFPKSICTSVNDCICHGVPDDKPLKLGDIINVDVTVIKDEFHGDTSAMFFVGDVSEKAKDICMAAEQAMLIGIEEVKPGATTGDIGFAINKLTTRKGYHVVREIGGHGIGRVFHDDPWVPSYGKKGKGEVLRPWSCLTVEPMINETAAPIKEMPIPNSAIKWYVTGDNTLSAQYEHTVLITDKGHQVLTLRD